MFTELAHEAACFGLIGELVEAAEQGGSLGLQQEGGERGYDLLDHAEGRFAEANGSEVAEGRRQNGTQGFDMCLNT